MRELLRAKFFKVKMWHDVFYISFPHVLCPWHCQSNPIEVYIPVELWVKAFFGLPTTSYDIYLSSTRNAPRISQMKLTLEWHRAFGPRNDCQDPQQTRWNIFQGATMTHPLRMGDRCCLHAPTCLQVSAFFLGGRGHYTDTMILVQLPWPSPQKKPTPVF